MCQTTCKCPEDNFPVFTEINQQRDGRRQMQRDDESQKIRVGLIELPADQSWQENRLPQTADWKKFRNPLQAAERECLKSRHRHRLRRRLRDVKAFSQYAWQDRQSSLARCVTIRYDRSGIFGEIGA